jgi:hypothetical protein
MYLLEKLELDYLENTACKAIQYIPYAIVHDFETAKKLADAAGVATKNECWAIYKPIPRIKISELPVIDIPEE